MGLQDHDEEVQSFDLAEHPDNVPLDVPVPAATIAGDPIPEALDPEDDPELGDVDIDAITPGMGEEGDA